MAVTASSSLVNIYANGANVASSSSMSFVSIGSYGTLSNPYIGRSQFSANPYMNAYLRDFRCYDSALRSVADA